MRTFRRRRFIADVVAGSVTAFAGLNLGFGRSRSKPNFVILFADDMGYGDWSRGGHPTIRTPNLQQMADQGIQLTQFYSGNPVCSPSRSALLTGRNCIRTGIVRVLSGKDTRGLAHSEITIAEALKPMGYATACIGKWHLGSVHEYRPLRQGFDNYFGLLYSNDMADPDLYRDDEIIEHPAQQATLTRRYTEQAIGFIKKHKDQPFFLYLPYTMPHVPLHASDAFAGRSKRGLYGDVIEEIDWSVGEINGALRELGLSENTLVLFTSDNGPWMTKQQRGGTAGLLRGAKGDTWEGGMRVPFVACWPKRIPKGEVSSAVASVVDLLPTLVHLAGGSVPGDRPLDGIDIMPALLGGTLADRPIYFYKDEILNAVRLGKWKLHFSVYQPRSVDPQGRPQGRAETIVLEKPLLFDLESDPSERFDIAADHPDVVAKLTAQAESYRAEVQQRGENKALLESFRRRVPRP